LGERVRKLVLFEPNPFALLDSPGYLAAYTEVKQLYHFVKEHGRRGEWLAVAERFADYFTGDGVWATMSMDRRCTLAASLRPNLHEWDAVMDSALSRLRWKVSAPTLLLGARDSRPALRAIGEILHKEYPNWECLQFERGGHMAPLTRSR